MEKCNAIEIDELYHLIYRCKNYTRGHRGPHFDDQYGEWVG